MANLRRLHRLRRIMANEAPDAVLAFLPEIGALATLAAFGTGIPVIVSERASPIDQPLPAAWRPLRRLAYRSAAAVVFQTERGHGVPRLVQARGCAIPNPVDLPANPAADPAALEIVAAGRLVPQKGFDLLVGAFAAVADQHPGWRLTIWGEGPERDRPTALAARHGLGGRVRLPGTSQAPGGGCRAARSSPSRPVSRASRTPSARRRRLRRDRGRLPLRSARDRPRRDGWAPAPPENERALGRARGLMGSVRAAKAMVLQPDRQCGATSCRPWRGAWKPSWSGWRCAGRCRRGCGRDPDRACPGAWTALAATLYVAALLALSPPTSTSTWTTRQLGVNTIYLFVACCLPFLATW